MNKLFPVILLFCNLNWCLAQNLNYPPTIERPVINTYHGVNVIDEYQWLEDLNRPEILIWVDNQNKLSEKHLKKLANKHNSVNLMNKYMLKNVRWNTHNNINFDSKRKSNFRLFYSDQYATPSIYYKENSFNQFKVLLDPREISIKDRIEIESFEPSKDDKYVAYAFSRNGQDWREIQIKETAGQVSPKETLSHIKFSSINWFGDGFFYKQYPSSNITDKLGKPALYYHRLFTDQNQDSLIFESKNPLDELFMYSNFEESIYLLEIENKTEKIFSYFYFDSKDSISAFRPLFYKIDYSLSFVDYLDEHIIMLASINNRRHLISIPKGNPSAPKLITPEVPDAQLIDYEILNDIIVLSYQSLTKPYILVVDFSGQLIQEVTLPEGVSISSMNFQKASGEFIFFLESYTIPPVICQLDLESYEYAVIERTGVNFDFTDYKFKVEYVQSTEEAIVPMFIIYKNELKTDGSTPFLISAYGGYGVIGRPAYDPGVIYFLEQGGAFAYIHTRGGGELGTKWWNDGKRLNKQHCFDDVIAATEHLINGGYTSPDKTAVIGSSHGGLVTAAAVTQRPELFGAAIINAGLLDMLRYANVTVGSKWVDEFGTIENKEDFTNLASYSPYHHLSNQINYPPLLIMTGDSDDRVSPMHAYKFAARMQNLQNQKNPILLWSQEGMGHGGPSNMEDKLLTEAYVSSFLDEFVLNQND